MHIYASFYLFSTKQTTMIKFYNSLKIITCIFLLGFGVGSASGQALVAEDFDYGTTAGDLTSVSSSAWSAHSAGGSGPVGYVSAGLSLTNYPSSGVGGAATILQASSEDVNLSFTEQTTGIIYISGLVNLSSVASGDYFFHLKDGGFGFRARIGAKSDGAGGINFGIGASSSTLTYGSTSYLLNTTYLLVGTYNIDTGESKLYVLSSAEAIEPSSPEASNSGSAGTAISSVAFRQGSNTPDGTIDGVRVATNWQDIMELPAIIVDDSSFNGDFGFVVAGNNSDVRSYTVEAAYLTNDITVTPPEGFEVSTTSDFTSNVGTNVSPITLTQTGGSVALTTIYVRFSPDVADGSTDSGNISHVSSGATTENIAVTGTEGVDNVAPVFNSAVTTSGTLSSNIVVDFSEEITTTDASGFALSIGGTPATITGVTGSGTSQLSFTITEEIAKNSGTVLISYDGSGDAQDLASNALTTFTDEVVTNNTTLNVVSDIASARAQGLGADVRISGEVVISFQGNSADKIYVQDANAGLLIDDNGTINTVYNTGDGLINIEGTLVNGSGVMELAPLSDPGAANSSGNSITPLEVTMATFKGNIDTYESRVIKIVDISFNDAGATFSNFSNYDFTDGIDTLTFRPNFSDPDFSAVEVPYGQIDVIALAGEFNGSAQVVPFSNTEFVEDVYAPQFVATTTTADTTTNSFNVIFQADEPGTVYYVVNESATPPTAADIISTGSSMAYTNVATDVIINATGLTDNTQYYAHIILADDETIPNEQITATTVGAQTLEIIFDADSDIADPVTQVAAGTVSSIANDAGSAVDVFTFTLSDLGTADGEPTLVNTIVIEKGANNTVTDWSSVIAGAVLNDGTTDLTVTGTTINANDISFDLTGNEFSIADGASVEVTLSIYLNTTVVDEEVLEFEIPVTHGFQASVAGSIFVTNLAAAVTSNMQTIEVDATELAVSAPTTAAVNTDFTVSYSAVDANGNIDLANRTMEVSLASGTGTLSSVTGLTQDVFDGTFTWTDLQYDVVEDITLLVDDQGSALEGSTGTITISGAIDAPAQILISEVVVSPFGGEFIEIYNNTAGEVFLDNYYITDATFANGGVYYYNIVTGSDYGGGDFSDWHARFPSGSTIAAGEVQTIAINGSEEFFTAYGIEPTYELYEDGASADAVPDMLEAVTGSINNQGTLTDGDEFIVLYYWDGNTDLVVDIDYFHWGTSDEIVDKTGVSIDGPDADATASTYLNDTPIANQISVGTTHASGNSWQRIDFDEGAEINSGGNGVDGNDETSEDLNNTFIETVADPGNVTLPGTPLITITATAFNGNFGFVEFGTDSEVSSYLVEGVDLTADITITPPVGFEVSTTTDFSTTIGTNASPLVLTQSAGAVASTEVFVRFVPDAADGTTDSGDIVHSSAGAADRSVAVEGTEGAATITDIATARGLAESTEVTIQGIVTTPDYGFSNGQYYVQDATGGINIFHSGSQGLVNDGDEVEITGVIAIFNDLIEVEPSIVTVLSTGNTLPAATSIAEADLTVDNANQGTRVVISGVTLTDETQWPTEAISAGSNVDVDATVGTATFQITIDRGESFYDGSAVPDQPFTLTGILTRDGTTVQILPFFDGDISTESAGPGITTDVTGFNADFGTVQVNSNSAVSSYTVSASGLTEDLTLTIAGEFEVSLTQDFSAQVGNASTPLAISQTQGDVEPTVVYVRFSPTVAGTTTGSITHSSTGVDTQVIDLSGEGTEEEVTAIDPTLIKQSIKLFPNPVNNGSLTVELSETLGQVEVKLMTLTGTTLQSTTTLGTTTLKVGGMKSGIYILQLSNDEFTQNYRVILK